MSASVAIAVATIEATNPIGGSQPALDRQGEQGQARCRQRQPDRVLDTRDEHRHGDDRSDADQHEAGERRRCRRRCTGDGADSSSGDRGRSLRHDHHRRSPKHAGS